MKDNIATFEQSNDPQSRELRYKAALYKAASNKRKRKNALEIFSGCLILVIIAFLAVSLLGVTFFSSSAHDYSLYFYRLTVCAIVHD
ncbi:MAG: hypothetical protein CUN51_06045 [Candidatus Thermofonsia Clade 1 bacterium]|uniref:Uncharacterized protein n=1 Tax=Candidatus Thermofonsia Clade 1 bacterium TaxID=2364210 RepID=A0A2M8P0G3_9CHLR|nr:MAG: hypothetical protein CUN51_06045 [Candidatus Thermofonsia Clade 1 bacterium]